jgi:PAS domain S-box-containing protein
MLKNDAATLTEILNHLSESVQVCDEHGIIRYCNNPTCEISGYLKSEVIDAPISLFDTSFSGPNSWSEFFTKLKQGKPQIKKGLLRTKTGNLIPVEASVTLLQMDSNPMALSIVRDISKETLAEAKQTLVMEILKTAASISEFLLNDDNVKEAIQHALKSLGQTVAVDRVYIFENYWKEKEDSLYSTLKYEWVNKGISEQINNPMLIDSPFQREYSFLFNTLNSGEIIHMHVKDMPEEIKSDFELQEIISLLLIPIRIKNRFWGMIGFDSCTVERNWSENEISFLKITANTLGMFIEKQESFTSLENLVREKEILLSELHHRTKNNLAIISGIIDLQHAFSSNPDVIAYSETIRERIQNIALIHEILSSSGKFSQLSFSEYVDLLIKRLESSFLDGKKLNKKIHIENFYIGSAQKVKANFATLSGKK